MKYPPGFYVYRLIDPRSCLPFYVGKGQRGRAWQHQQFVELGKPSGNARKDRKIREIIVTGQDVEVEIVASYELEIDALDHEFRLVDADPTLTNVRSGGISSNPILLERRRKRREEERVLARKKAIERDIKRRIAGFLAIEGADQHQSEIEKWVRESSALQLSNPQNDGVSALARYRAKEYVNFLADRHDRKMNEPKPKRRRKRKIRSARHIDMNLVKEIMAERVR